MRSFGVFILDDDPDAVIRMEFLLRKYDFLKVVGKETFPERAIPLIKSNKPDLIIIDIEMPGHSGFEVIEQVRDTNYCPKVIFVTAYDKYAIKAIKESAFDYLLKPVDKDELNETILKYINSLKDEKEDIKNITRLLTHREAEIFNFLRQGCTSREISVRLHISKNTVDTHRRRILKKLDIKSTTRIHLLYPLNE